MITLMIRHMLAIMLLALPARVTRYATLRYYALFYARYTNMSRRRYVMNNVGTARRVWAEAYKI